MLPTRAGGGQGAFQVVKGLGDFFAEVGGDLLLIVPATLA